jgi:hypothetical protein
MKGDLLMAMCKPDLVAAVLRQLGHDVPDPETLTKAVFEASAQLKKENGVAIGACLVMSPVKTKWYKGGIRDKTGYSTKVEI